MSTESIIEEARTFLITDRLAEIVSLVGYVSWAVSLIADGGMLQLHAFRGFSAPAEMYSAVFLGMSVVGFFGLFSSCAARRCAMVGLMMGACVWTVIGVEYWYSYPPFQPGMIWYPCLAIINYLVALEIEKDTERM